MSIGASLLAESLRFISSQQNCQSPSSQEVESALDKSGSVVGGARLLHTASFYFLPKGLTEDVEL